MNTLHEILKKEYQTAGWYSLGMLSIRFKTKPNFIKRFFMKHFLGFIWTDGTEEDWNYIQKKYFKSKYDL